MKLFKSKVFRKTLVISIGLVLLNSVFLFEYDPNAVTPLNFFRVMAATADICVLAFVAIVAISYGWAFIENWVEAGE